MKDDRACDNESPTIYVRNYSAEDAGSTTGKNLFQIIIPANKETNVFDLESNSGEKASQSKRSGRLKEDSSYDDESPAIDLRDSAAEDAGSTAGKNHPQIIFPENEEIIVPELKVQNRFKDNSVVLCPEKCLCINSS